ncbi:MAG: nuclear transport factor 2 family protein [Micrococcales bacterium]|nr:nuclear transport factor 2 family protein [Micrococcales bacterium]
MDESLTETLLDLERRGWDSLCDGTGAEFYGDLMTDDGVMVLAHGAVLDRAEVVASLADAPPWDDYAIDDVRVVALGADAASLVYRGTARREGADPFVGAMTSTYVRVDGAWRIAVYTQTVVPD